jgi:hypothetical protein
VQENPRARRTDPADFADAEREAAERTIEPVPRLPAVERPAGARNQVETPRPVGALGAEMADIAEVARLDEPDARQRDALLGGHPLDDPLEHRADLPLLGHAKRDGRQRLGTHGGEV